MLQPYSIEWINKYRNEAERIKETLGAVVLDIQHIGSTSVPGLAAKPIIDIAVLTKNISDSLVFTEKLKQIGYIYKPDMSSVERIFLRKGDPVEYHLSISESKYSYWSRQLLFRDYLRSHPEAAKEYQNIKERSVEELPRADLEDLSRSKRYSAHKKPFIEKILKLASEE